MCIYLFKYVYTGSPHITRMLGSIEMRHNDVILDSDYIAVY